MLTGIQDIKKNWSTVRCRPDVMLMAQFYGYDAVENLEFCLKNGFDSRASSAISPFYTYLGSFTGILTSMLSNINSIRLTFATLVGSATTVFSNFSDRLKSLMYRVQMTAIRMKFMMGRVFASMYAIIFMGLSGIKAGENFSKTILWGFLDAFCFDPDTPIYVRGAGFIPIRAVKIGDILVGGEVVSSTFQFHADGQTMVRLGDILVSTNHYLLHNGAWIRADEHPDAVAAAPWHGGLERPLICLNTTTNSFQIGPYTFRDYDETSQGDKEAMEKALTMLNGSAARRDPSRAIDSTMACSPDTRIKCAPGHPSMEARHITLGTPLTHGKVVAVIDKVTTGACTYKGEVLAPGTAVWTGTAWARVSDLVDTEKVTPTIFRSFILSSATIETESGLLFRDYMEVHDPDMETSYVEALEKPIKPIEC